MHPIRSQFIGLLASEPCAVGPPPGVWLHPVSLHASRSRAPAGHGAWRKKRNTSQTLIASGVHLARGMRLCESTTRPVRAMSVSLRCGFTGHGAPVSDRRPTFRSIWCQSCHLARSAANAGSHFGAFLGTSNAPDGPRVPTTGTASLVRRRLGAQPDVTSGACPDGSGCITAVRWGQRPVPVRSMALLDGVESAQGRRRS